MFASDSDSVPSEPAAKNTKQCAPSAGADVVAFLGTLGYKHYAPALARAGFACMAELA